MCWRRASGRWTRWRARSRRASPTRRSTCGSWPGRAWCARVATGPRGRLPAGERAGRGPVGGGARRRGPACRRGVGACRRVPGRAGRASSRCRPPSWQSGWREAQVVVLDVRPEAEYRGGHIAGALSAPLGDARVELPKLPRRREIVAYCRGPYCVYADDAVRLLQARGVKARRLDVGFPEWRRAGLPVESASWRLDAAATVPERRHARVRATCSAARRTASSRSSTRTSTSSTTTSPRRRRSARRSWRCSRRTCRPTTSPGCPRWSSAPARPRICRPVRASSSSTSRSPTATWSSSGTRVVTAIATPGHAPAHHAYAVADRRRGTEEPWLVFSGDSLLIGDVGRPDLHVAGDAHGQARLLHASPAPAARAARPRRRLTRATTAGSVCGRGLSGNPVSSIGFERAHNPMLALADAGRVRRRAGRRHAAARRPSRSGSSPPTAPGATSAPA